MSTSRAPISRSLTVTIRPDRPTARIRSFQIPHPRGREISPCLESSIYSRWGIPRGKMLFPEIAETVDPLERRVPRGRARHVVRSPCVSLVSGARIHERVHQHGRDQRVPFEFCGNVFDGLREIIVFVHRPLRVYPFGIVFVGLDPIAYRALAVGVLFARFWTLFRIPDARDPVRAEQLRQFPGLGREPRDPHGHATPIADVFAVPEDASPVARFPPIGAGLFGAVDVIEYDRRLGGRESQGPGHRIRDSRRVRPRWRAVGTPPSTIT